VGINYINDFNPNFKFNNGKIVQGGIYFKINFRGTWTSGLGKLIENQYLALEPRYY
jgi:hypothetical protein